MKKLFQRRKGFTLIELLIVIVIIGILAVGFAPTLLNAPKKARDGVRKGQIASIQQAIEAYALDNSSGYPPAIAGFCLPPTLDSYFQGSTKPVDPDTKNAGACGTPGLFGYDIDTVNKCYWIAAHMEIPENNNGDSVVNCAVVPGAKKNFLQVVKY